MSSSPAWRCMFMCMCVGIVNKTIYQPIYLFIYLCKNRILTTATEVSAKFVVFVYFLPHDGIQSTTHPRGYIIHVFLTRDRIDIVSVVTSTD